MRTDVGALPRGVAFDTSLRDGCRLLRLTATQSLSGLATGSFSRLAAGVGLDLGDGDPATAPSHVLGLAFTQFALPVVAGPALDFDFRPAANLHSPPVVGLLAARSVAGYTLLAPLDHPHEQVISLAGRRLAWGWHGDLDEVPEGFVTTLGVFSGATLGSLLAQWGATVRAGAPRPDRAANPLTSHLSYWTDNGAAYWYRTEAGRTLGASVADAVEQLRANDVPVTAVELDSWCYRHEVPRPIAAIGYPEEVPPSGMAEWEPRPDAFDPVPEGSDTDAIEAFADRLGRPPLVIHARHISPRSPYLETGDWWVDDLAAHPVDPAFFTRWFDDAQRWGVCAIEQDWMLMYWFGVRALRAVPGRAAAWQRGLDQLAADSGVGLVWCMATPADMVLAAALGNVIAVRTCDDYRFADDPALLWTWYLTVNRVVCALGLRAFKDCFFSQVPDSAAESIDGDVHAELEALLASMSAGPVGIGDRAGHTDRDIVLRTCDADGRLRHVDEPLGLVDGCLFGEPARGERLAWATTTATRDGQRWRYVVAINTATEPRPIRDSLLAAEIGLTAFGSLYDWRNRRTVAAEAAVEIELAPRDWALWVCPPPGESVSAGDVTKYVVVSSDQS